MRAHQCRWGCIDLPGAAFADLSRERAIACSVCAPVWSGIELILVRRAEFERRTVMTRKNMLSLAAAAALSVGGFALAQDDKNSAERAADKTGQAVDRAADNTSDAAKNAAASWNVGRIHTTLSGLTESALSKGGFDDLVERLVDADRNRIGTWMKDDANKGALDKLDGRIAQFQKDWKAKYGGDFDIKNDAQVFGTQHFQYAMGEIGKDAQVAGEKLPGQQNVNT